MKTLSVATLCEVLEVSCPKGADQMIRGISIDSRTLQPGNCFWAIRGDHFDGHDFLGAAQQRQAACIVAEMLPDKKLSIPVLKVSDTIAALGKLAAWYRDRLSATVIGITGSAGKTSTRQILHHVLSHKYRCRQSPKSFNNQIGVPLTLLAAEEDDEILLVELGSNHPGEIISLTKMAQPDIAVITHIAPAHLEGFGSIQAIIEEKASILEGLKADGKIFINGDIPELAAYIRRKYKLPFTMVGESSYCDIRADRMHSTGTSGWLRIEGQMITVPLAGFANLRNVLTVWSVCRDFKVALSDFAAAIRTMQPAAMRLQVEHIGPLTLLNDCYNANPASMENALDCLRRLSAEQRRRSVVIAGDMKELGPHSVSLHRQIGTLAANSGIAVLLAVGEYAESFIQGAAKADNRSMQNLQMRTFGSVESLCNNVHQYIRPDDIILVKASRSVRLERAVDRLRELFGTKQAIE